MENGDTPTPDLPQQDDPSSISTARLRSDDQASVETSRLQSNDPGSINTTRIQGHDNEAKDSTQEMSKVALISAANAHFNVGLSTDVGMIRTTNQDAASSFVALSRTADAQPEFAILVVADGMGGHLDGELASATAVRTVVEHLLASVYLPFLKMSEISDRMPISEAIEEAIQAAHIAVINNVPDGGTTITVAVLMGNLAHIGHAGDSRAYLVTGDKLDQITRDHSLVQRMIDMNEINADQAEHHPQKNVVYRALGQSDNLEVDTFTRRLLPGSALLLCSDGLWGMVKASDLKEHAVTMPPQQACDHLVALANQHGGQDNISVIIARIPG
jgi:protein phosphatase